LSYISKVVLRDRKFHSGFELNWEARILFSFVEIRPMAEQHGSLMQASAKRSGGEVRAAIYLRASDKPDGRNQTSEAENQSVRLHEFATALGWTIVAEFTDRNSAGAKADRTQFEGMMAAAWRRDFDVVLVWSLDPFSGEGIYKTLQRLNTLSGYGVAFRSLNEPFIDTTSESGDLLRSVFAFFAAYERKHLGDRVRAGHDRVRAQGKHVGRLRTTTDGKLLAEVRRLRTEGHSMRQIMDILDLERDKMQRLASNKELREKTRSVLKVAIAQVKTSTRPGPLE
jgi:DNA invertase Pin-like site-specific DNA recombinase